MERGERRRVSGEVFARYMHYRYTLGREGIVIFKEIALEEWRGY
jgi:hypothetical protein